MVRRVTDAKELHKRAPVADAHADCLMWNRDLNHASPEGHVDFPRLYEAGVKIQCFTIVTRGLPIIGGFPLLRLKRGWPKAARGGEWASCLWQIERLEQFCSASNGKAAIATTADELETNLRDGRLSGVIGIEGGHAVEMQLSRVKELYDRGVRFMSLTHLGNNELGGSSFPFVPQKPLSEFGRQVLSEMVSLGMSVDLAHASKKTLADILENKDARIFCSHTGVRTATDSWRNMPDDALKAIADRGGVAGIIFAPMYVGGWSVSDVARHIERAVEVMGEDGVGFGSDFDGMIPLPKGMRDVRDLHLITEELLRRGHPEGRVEKIIGGNFRRFFRETLGRRAV